MKPYEQIQGIYIHIPFCLQKCIYCDFVSFGKESLSTMEEYTKALCAEIKQRAKEMPVSPKATIYFGGGTPSVLPLELVGKIVAALKENGLWQKPQEATIEVNPGTVDFEKLQGLKALGFSRISFGVQSLQDSELKTMGRIHTAKEALEAIRDAKKAGFEHLNADLIVGFPGQTMASIEDSLQKLTKENLGHVSVYGLSVEEGTVLAHKLLKKELELPSEEVAAKMYEYTNEFLPKEGFCRYEISNYAHLGEESRHNLVYWRYQPYLGLGLNATSFDGKQRLTNPKTLREYLGGKEPLREVLTQENLVGEAMFMGLRKVEGVNLEEIEERFCINIMKKYGKEIEENIQKGLLQLGADQKVLSLTPLGMQFGNQVFEIFL